MIKQYLMIFTRVLATFTVILTKILENLVNNSFCVFMKRLFCSRILWVQNILSAPIG